MKRLIIDIFAEIACTGVLNHKELSKIIGKHNVGVHDASQRFAKKHILPAYLRMKEDDPLLLLHWGIDPALERDFLATVQMKPRRTSSGVATITVITKPWPCSSACLYCPNDVRMPKSYLSDEPACQRAEQNFFDPYLQVAARLRALHQMGHATDKIELIVLGGTWSDYPQSYQLYVIHQLFAALNDSFHHPEHEDAIRRRYHELGIAHTPEEHAYQTASLQQRILSGELSYNQAVKLRYDNHEAYQQLAREQQSTWDAVIHQQKLNESANHRVVGLVIETRPDLITPHNLSTIRKLGCTKVQIGIQSIDQQILDLNHRNISISRIQRAFYWLRYFGFKIHAHYMVNLLGAHADDELRQFNKFMSDPHYMPDEVKLYPCVLVDGTELVSKYECGAWQPYSEQELTQLLAQMVVAVPPFTRISRMIRDISSNDIMAGNKKTNLRQMVEHQLDHLDAPVREIRYREINHEAVALDGLHLDIVPYHTVGSDEYFLQWVTDEQKIAGFLRLSLPHCTHDSSCPPSHEETCIYVDASDNSTSATHALNPSDDAKLPPELKAPHAMIREIHIYGHVARINQVGDGAQHSGLGTMLVDQAMRIARDAGFNRLLVISAVGTRNYYRKLGFVDDGMYQVKQID